MRKLFILLFTLSLTNYSSSQVVIENNNTIEWYVQNVLLGEGISATNITFNGAPANQINVQGGYFNSVNSNVGLDSGFVMASGNILNVVGPNTSGSSSQPSVDMISGDPDLELLIPGFTVNDVAILEFDFVPSSDTLSFNYVFGSEEYLEFVNSSFNDVFGFFLSGPALTGPYSSPAGFPDGSVNIALIPGSAVPVTIDNVNNVVNSAYYFNNEILTGGTEIQLDGFTVPLEAVSAVVCGELHHIKIAIADAGDSAWDSAVFLEAGSFTSTPEDLVLNSYFDAGIVETSGVCDSSFANFNRICAADSAWYQLKFQGDALEGVDYQVFGVPDTILLAPQQFVFNFGLLATADGVTEGPEFIEVILCSTATLDEPFLAQDTAYIEILDEFVLPVTAPDIELICPAEEVVLTAEATDGVPVFNYTWYDETGAEAGMGPVIVVPVPASGSETYTVDIVDFCGFSNGPTSVTVTNSIPPDPVVTIEEDADPFCPGAPYDLTAVIQDGTPNFTYTWTTTDNTQITTITAPVGSLNPYPVQVFITDFCNRVAEASLDLIPPDLIVPEEGLVNIHCFGDELDIETLVFGGTPPYQYFYYQANPPMIVDPSYYDPTTGIGSIPDLEIGDNYVYQVVVTDYCTQYDPIYTGFDFDTLDVITCFIPNVFTPNDDDENDSFKVFELLSKSGTLHIYDRWGIEVHTGRQHDWDGEDFNGGTYYYLVEFDDGTETKTGSFTMIR